MPSEETEPNSSEGWTVATARISSDLQTYVGIKMEKTVPERLIRVQL
ncbi:hypothetical protein SAMN05421819_1112 [Bryocella elongata]|uniref:Uncharacterized protein n=1 Tax=Bryocella elongata TaxID=863522 RepID=A0A1H5UNR9_9BACT|nr:hypothetical protein SAMN05421819_1112 [Bryocella elongata]